MYMKTYQSRRQKQVQASRKKEAKHERNESTSTVANKGQELCNDSEKKLIREYISHAMHIFLQEGFLALNTKELFHVMRL